MWNQNMAGWMRGLFAMLLLLLASAQSQATNVLISGNAMSQSNSNLVNAVAGLGLQATYVAPSSFVATSLAGFDAVWLDGFSQYGSGTWPANLVTFMNGGGKVFVQNPGFGSESLPTYPLGAQLAAVFTYPPGQDTISIVDTSSPPGANHSVNQGLSNAGLSQWNASAYGYFSNIGGFTGLTNTGTVGQWVTIVSPVGAGYLVYTEQGVSQFLGSPGNPGAGSDAARFLYNVVTLNLNPVPEPPMLSLFLVGLAVGMLRVRRTH